MTFEFYHFAHGTLPGSFVRWIVCSWMPHNLR
jgi:hypothetical protein